MSEVPKNQWYDVHLERDGDGLLTPVAMACDAITEHGCDCGTDEAGTCLACVCEAALRDLWEQREKLRVLLARSTAILSQFQAEWAPIRYVGGPDLRRSQEEICPQRRGA